MAPSASMECRNITKPLRGIGAHYIPWLRIAKEYRLHHDRMYAHWASICTSMTNQPPAAEDDISLAAALRRVQSATTGKWRDDSSHESYAYISWPYFPTLIPYCACCEASCVHESKTCSSSRDGAL